MTDSTTSIWLLLTSLVGAICGEQFGFEPTSQPNPRKDVTITQDARPSDPAGAAAVTTSKTEAPEQHAASPEQNAAPPEHRAAPPEDASKAANCVLTIDKVAGRGVVKANVRSNKTPVAGSYAFVFETKGSNEINLVREDGFHLSTNQEVTLTSAKFRAAASDPFRAKLTLNWPGGGTECKAEGTFD